MNKAQKKASETLWRAKAMKKVQEMKKLKRRIKELEKGRDSWKEKAMQFKTEVEKIAKQKRLVEAKLQKTKIEMLKKLNTRLE